MRVVLVISSEQRQEKATDAISLLIVPVDASSPSSRYVWSEKISVGLVKNHLFLSRPVLSQVLPESHSLCPH